MVPTLCGLCHFMVRIVGEKACDTGYSCKKEWDAIQLHFDFECLIGQLYVPNMHIRRNNYDH